MVGAQTQSGENINEMTALTYSAVWNAVTLIAGTIGALPLHLMQERGRGKEISDDRRVYRIMHDAWNPYMTAMAGRETLMSHVLTWGNGYAEIMRNAYGEITELWPITPNRVTPEMKDNRLLYRLRLDSKDVYLPREKVLHVPGLSYDGMVGYSVIAYARNAIGLGKAMETFGSRYFGAGTHPGLVVSHPAKLSQTASQNLQSTMSEAYSGLGNTHRLLLLEEGMKVEKIGIPPDDSQFLESRQFQITDIARWFNLPVHKLKEMTKSSFNNIQEEQQSFVTDAILPWLVRLEQNYNMQLLTRGDRMEYGAGKLYFKHNVEGLLRGDEKSRGEFYTKMFSIGAMSINEIRALEDLDPIDGGDIHMVPMNMIPLEQMVAQPTLVLPAKPKELPAKGNGQDVEETEEEEAESVGAE